MICFEILLCCLSSPASVSLHFFFSFLFLPWHTYRGSARLAGLPPGADPLRARSVSLTPIPSQFFTSVPSPFHTPVLSSTPVRPFPSHVTLMLDACRIQGPTKSVKFVKYCTNIKGIYDKPTHSQNCSVVHLPSLPPQYQQSGANYCSSFPCLQTPISPLDLI